MADAVAARRGACRAAERAPRAMLRGDLGAVAAAALARAARRRCAAIGLRGRPPGAPMLARPADDVAEALETRRRRRGRVEARRRAHPGAPRRRRGRVFTPHPRRRHRAACPRSSRRRCALPVRSVVLDGEAIALRADGRPAAVPGTACALRRARAAPTCRCTALFFDVLHLDGEDLLDRAGARARRALAAVVPERAARARAVVTDDADGGRRRPRRRARRGHEGVMVKALDAPYEAGRRGAGWLQGQAGAHARPRRARRRVGPRPAQRLAVQPAPRRPRRHRRRRS